MFSSPITRRAVTSQSQTQSFDLTAALRYMNDKTVKHVNALLSNLGLSRFESHICTLTHNPLNEVPGVQPRVGIDISSEVAFKFFEKFLEKKGIIYNIMRHEDARGLDPKNTIQTIIIYKIELEAKLSSKDFAEFIDGFDAELNRVQPVMTAAVAVNPEQFDLNKAVAIINDHIKEFWYSLGADFKDNQRTSFKSTESGYSYQFDFRNATALDTFKQFLTSCGVGYEKNSAPLIVLRNDLEKSLKSEHLAQLSDMLDKAFDDYMVEYKRQSGALRLA